jgi:hypothetical protein
MDVDFSASPNYVLLCALGSCQPWQSKHCQGFAITLRFLRQDTHSTAPLS